MWRRSGRIEDRARARVDSKAGEAEGRRCGPRGEHLLVQPVPAKLRSIRDESRRDALQQGSRSEGPGGCTNPRTKSSAEQFRFRRIRRRTCSLQLSEFMTTSISWDARWSSSDCQSHGKWKSKASKAHFLGVDHRPRNDGTGRNSIESDDDSCVSKAPGGTIP